MKHLKLFETEAHYESFKSGSDFVLPNVSYCEDGKLFYNALEETLKANLADIAYWDGSKVKTVSQDKWNSGLGTPVGVVVIPSGFAPDGKARIASLSFFSKKEWGNYNVSNVETSLNNYTCVPITPNNTETVTIGYKGYLPSDDFTGTQSYVDPDAQYLDINNPMIPSPYITRNDKFEANYHYYSNIYSGNDAVNALSDFNGLSNTEHLVGLGSDYIAANTAWNYTDDTDGSSNLQWYLPAAGEMGYFVVRQKAIFSALYAIGLLYSGVSGKYWSSTEQENYDVWCVDTNYGIFEYYNKINTFKIWPFAMLDY